MRLHYYSDPKFNLGRLKEAIVQGCHMCLYQFINKLKRIVINVIVVSKDLQNL